MQDDPVLVIRAIHRLERELAAARKLSEIKIVAAQLRCMREALPRLEAEAAERENH